NLRWITRHNRVRRYIARYHTAGSNDCILADRHIREDCYSRTDGCAALYDSLFDFPVLLSLQMSALGRRARIRVVDKRHAVADENIVLNRHAFADERVA